MPRAGRIDIPRCFSKKLYLTYAHAKNDQRAVRDRKNAYLDIYHCRHCNAFHLGGRSNLRRRKLVDA